MVVVPERRTAMYHTHLAMGAVMADADGWQLPCNSVTLNRSRSG